MTIMTIEQQILDEVRQMSPAQQREVLEAARRIKDRPEGEPGHLLLKRAREINFPAEDLAEIAEAIKDFDEIVPDKEIDLDDNLPS
jgi:pyruvate-formate lyase-activating enzyme